MMMMMLFAGLAPTSEACSVSDCGALLAEQQDPFCSAYREKVPRPALFNRCNEGYFSASAIACAELCTNEFADVPTLLGMAYPYCHQWARNPQRSYLTACIEGYAQAIQLAKTFASEHFVRSASHIEMVTNEDGHEDSNEARRWRSGSSSTAQDFAESRLRQAKAQALEEYAYAELD